MIEVLEVVAGLPAEKARVVLPKLSDPRVAAVRWQAALDRRTDDLQHQRERQMPEYTAEAIECTRAASLPRAWRTDEPSSRLIVG
jgi:hypothetical protein